MNDATTEGIARAAELAARFDVPHCVVVSPHGHEWIIGEDLAISRGHSVLATVSPGGCIKTNTNTSKHTEGTPQ